MDRVFPKNMDPVDREDTKKAVGVLEDYVRYMKEQIEWAIGVILRLNGGTSLAKVSMDIEAIKSGLSSLQRDGVDYNNRITSLSGEIREIERRLSIVENNPILSRSITTEITEDSTDNEIPTAKAVYDFTKEEAT